MSLPPNESREGEQRKEHAPYVPASRSIAAGETGGTSAKTVLGGFGIGFLYEVLGGEEGAS